MNAPRMVSALAALAVGFGITLVGVNVADDTSDVVESSAESTVADDVDATPDDAVDQTPEAEQDEELADPPPEADVIDETGEPATSDGASAPRDTNAPRPSETAPEHNCEPVLVVLTGSGELLILSERRGEVERESGEWFLPDDDVPVEERFEARDLLLVDGVVIDDANGRAVQDCETGEIFEATVVVEPQASGAVFPCSDDAFGALIAELDPLEATELIDDTDVFVRVVAKSLAGFGSASVAQWEADLSDHFSRFVDPEGCTSAIEDVFIDGRDGFFCAAANVSADARLFGYLDDVVPSQMLGCSYVQEEGAN